MTLLQINDFFVKRKLTVYHRSRPARTVLNAGYGFQTPFWRCYVNSKEPDQWLISWALTKCSKKILTCIGNLHLCCIPLPPPHEARWRGVAPGPGESPGWRGPSPPADRQDGQARSLHPPAARRAGPLHPPAAGRAASLRPPAAGRAGPPGPPTTGRAGPFHQRTTCEAQLKAR
jgi:hypothetical protein